MVAMVPFRALIAFIALASVSAGGRIACAEDASPWVNDAHSTLRLLAGSRTGAVLMGGVEIQLQPGWKTYWRTPGDSGVPPRFDFSKSVNVESVTPLFPAPKKFDDGAGGVSYGYGKSVVFPLRIVPKNPNEPVQLRALINYAVCEKLCLPVEAEAELSFTSTASTLDSLVTTALNKVPKPVGTSEAMPIAIQSFKRVDDRAVVDVAAPAGAHVELFAEGPSPDWALPVPKRTGAPQKGLIRYEFKLDGLPANARPEGAILKLTLVGEEGAFEYNVRLN
ncbi:protein-disulfide reductase DsbD domain-containing protein [Bradyrhizobium sp. LHD-71]|uniref:protein-disulfide reductase DsbD domain-containing protein n=1 Tax=Bradyrhizobium sp. LHD-71 TaxID=3072141 RepID=UPI00280EC3A9|nr:protein-disulfide reductase DsbD domain-containing protein [Bradyrhizobium sp. LHD-71]MDQ8726715.1 protein-disulfide reductase DsbD family protein [Bradyrhizobium sp. LHD-71]